MNQAPCASVMLTVAGRMPLLATPALARAVCAGLEACVAHVPGRLWGYVVLPDAVRLVLGPVEQELLQDFVTQVKAETTARALDAIRRTDNVCALDAVLRFSPVWGGALYRVWQDGFHCTWLHGPAQLHHALEMLRQAPVRAGLVADSSDWPHRRFC